MISVEIARRLKHQFNATCYTQSMEYAEDLINTKLADRDEEREHYLKELKENLHVMGGFHFYTEDQTEYYFSVFEE